MAGMTLCKKCGYERTEHDSAPETECPSCGAIYAKVEVHLARQAEEEAEREAERQRKAEQEAARQAEQEAKRAEARLRNSRVCTACGHVGKPKQMTRGSLGIEVVLWLCFLIPGLIYTLWRHGSRYSACPMCRNPAMIPGSSPKGRALIQGAEGEQ